MTNNVLRMGIHDLMAHAPRQRNLVERDGDDYGMWVCLPDSYRYSDAPVYRDPAHLAVWLIGYWAGQAAGEDKARKLAAREKHAPKYYNRKENNQ